MRDKLSKSNFYFNGETAATRWVLNPRTLKKNQIEITDMRLKKKKRKKRKRRRTDEKMNEKV